MKKKKLNPGIARCHFCKKRYATTDATLYRSVLSCDECLIEFNQKNKIQLDKIWETK